jgi:hypothetical protein
MVADYQESPRDTNGRLSVSDGLVASTNDVRMIRNHRSNVLQSPGLNGFKALHGQVGEVLRTQYTWAQKPFLD